jgi:hypothetical protein
MQPQRQSIGKINTLFHRQEEYCWVSQVVKHASPRPRIGEAGTYRAIYQPEVPSFWAFWRRARVRAKGGCRLREVNRMGGGSGLGSGHLESIECPRR